MSTQYLTDDIVRELAPPAKANKIHFDADAPGYPGTGIVGFGIRVTSAGHRAWIFRYRLKDGSGDYRKFTIGRFPHVGAERARKRALALRIEVEQGGDPQDDRVARRDATKLSKLEAAAVAKLKPVIGLHERVAAKFAMFQELDIKPQGFLYRHFEPNGDLLYVGITMSILSRTKAHLKEAAWKHSICMIVIEPFETREELLEAERVAIRTEFPKYNNQLNKHRHPAQELSRLAPASN